MTWRRGRRRRLQWCAGLMAMAMMTPLVGRGATIEALDPSFGPTSSPGIVRFPGNAAERLLRSGVAVFPDGSVVASNGSEVRKFTAGGVADPSFGPSVTPGLVNVPCAQSSDLAIDAANRIIMASHNGCIGGNTPTNLVFRLSANGVIDSAFDGTVSAASIFGPTTVVNTQGGIVVSTSGNGEACLYRFLEVGGANDPGFGGPIPGRACIAMSGPHVEGFGALRADGGYLLVASDSVTTSVARFTSAGIAQGPPVQIDLGTFAAVSDIEATPDGGFLLAGNTFSVPSASWVKHFGTAGHIDATFNSGGSEVGTRVLDSRGGVWSIAPFAGGRFALSGSFNQAAQALLITADGQTDGALEAGSQTPGKLTLGASSLDSPTHTSVFGSATSSNGRLVVVGTEWDHQQAFDAENTMAVVVRSDVIGPTSATDVVLFRPTPPTRVLDTRPGDGQVGYSGAKPVPDSTFDLQIAGRAGLPSSNVGAVAMNLTATEATAAGYISVWPSGGPKPNVSSLNLERVGQTLPNLVIVLVGADGKISIYTLRGTHLIGDVSGWFPAFGGAQPIVPTRILETRPGPTQTGYSGPKPTSGQTLSVQVAGRAGLPASGVDVAIVNLTATEADAPGYVSAWPSGTQRPMSSNLNVSRSGQTIQNLVMVPVGADGAFNLYNFGGAHLIVDLVAWLPKGSGYRPFPFVNPRVVDTRDGLGVPAVGPIAAGGTVHVGSLPNSVVMVNVVAVAANGPGFFTAWPTGVARPLASNLNVEFAGQTISNSVLVTTDSDGVFDLFTQSGADVIADVFGVFPLPD